MDNFKCDDLLKDRIRVYHATDKLKTIKEQGYLGKDRNVYFSLTPELAVGYDESHKFHNLAMDDDYKVINFEIDTKDANINYESPLAANIAFNLNNFNRRVCGKNREVNELCTILTKALHDQDDTIPLVDIYPICKILNGDEFAKLVYGVYLKENKKINID